MSTQKLSKDHSIYVTDEKINTITHLIAACFSILGGTLLVTQAAIQGDIWKIVGLSIYSACLIVLFTFSTLHHGVNSTEKVNKLLRTLDYSAVFLLIAGTVTPLCMVIYRNPFGWAVFGTVWFIALFGIVLRSTFQYLPKYITNTIYIVMGWIPVVLVFDKPHLTLHALLLLALGGLIYSIGFVVYIIEKPNLVPGKLGFHEIWHVLVMLAALLHYMLMYFYVLK